MLERLQEINITHVIVACWETKQWFPEVFSVLIKCLHFTQAFQYMQLSVADSHMEFLIENFDQTYEFIETAKSRGGSILIHCMGGVSRSPTIVMKFRCLLFARLLRI